MKRIGLDVGGHTITAGVVDFSRSPAKLLRAETVAAPSPRAAELLVGKRIEIDREQAAPIGEDESYIVDLVGCRVLLSDGTPLGVLDSVDNFGSADIFTVKGDRTVRFPFLRRLGLSYDGQAKTVTIDKARFEEVCCYED